MLLNGHFGYCAASRETTGLHAALTCCSRCSGPGREPPTDLPPCTPPVASDATNANYLSLERNSSQFNGTVPLRNLPKGTLLRKGDNVPTLCGGLRSSPHRGNLWKETDVVGVYRRQPHQQHHLRDEGCPPKASAALMIEAAAPCIH